MRKKAFNRYCESFLIVPLNDLFFFAFENIDNIPRVYEWWASKCI